MAKQLNVDLRFNADTSAAKAQLQSLQTSITQLTTSMATQGTQLGITPQLQQAQQAAVQLKTALQQSMNVETGKFDLSKFKSSLKSMNTDLSKLKTQLVNLGPSGQQTFMTLAQSIMTAEIPTKRISASLAALGTTLKNTVKWQLSSTMLHGFMSAVQTSYRYAQDLNKSLNNIRIVTGESAEAMDQFAARANKAAKALSASTLDYTNAALIYYQQGLKGKDVEERAEVTLKLANVSRQSAEVVSDQMTAIWNNFYDGSKSLEYYADVLTKLGATTASSTDEIAGGLEKFAAVGQTIGLSYEYAASALATITANTRQSEEVVGTALKTIFARIQGLKLGETLEDGTELNKYSEALYKVGIDIYDANRQIKDMDTILDETAARWKTLGRDQQAALAQTVAGVRQYTQFIALMDNWDDGTGDSMVNNLQTAADATGELQNQADIYAESWEGANKRVKAAIEEVYSDLLNDDFFIDITNGLADILGLLDNFLDSMGGAKGLLTGLGSILLTVFAGNAAKGLENMVYNFKSFIGLAQKEAVAMKQQTYGLVQSLSATGASPTQLAITTGLQGQMELQNSLLAIQDKLSTSEQLQAKYIIEQNNAYAEQVRLLAQAEEEATKKKISAQTSLNSSMENAYIRGFTNDDGEQLGQKMESVYNTSNKAGIDLAETRRKIFSNIDTDDSEAMKLAMQEYKTALQEAAKKINTSADGVQTATEQMIQDEITHLNNQSKGGKVGRANYIAEQQKKGSSNEFSRYSGISAEQYGASRAQVNEEMLNSEDLGVRREARRVQNDFRESVRKTAQSFGEEKAAAEESTKGIKTFTQQTKSAKEQLMALGTTTMSWSQTIVGAAQAAMSLSFAINSLKSLGTTWADKNIGVGEKLLQTFMSLGMAIPMLMNGFSGLGKVLGTTTYMQNMMNLSTLTFSKAKQAEIAQLTAEQLVEKTGMSLDAAQLVLDELKAKKIMEQIALKGRLMTESTKEFLMKKLNVSADQIKIITDELAAGASWKKALATAGVTSSLKLNTKALWANVAATWAKVWPVLAVIAALAILVTAIKLTTDAYNADANAAKAAAEAAKEAGEEFEAAREKYENFKNAMTGYDEAIVGLKKLTKGTLEYKEQLMKVNEEAMKLIESQNLIYGQDYTYGEDGVIEFKDKYDENGKYLGKAHEVAKQDAFEEMQVLQASKQFADQRAKTTDVKADLTKFNREELTGGVDAASFGAKVGGFAAGGAGLGAVIGTIWPGVGNAVGAAVGAIAGAAVGLVAGVYTAVTTMGVSTEEEEKAMHLLAEKYEQLGDAALTREQIQTLANDGIDQSVIDDLINASKDNTSGLKEQLAAMNENTAAIRAMIEATAGVTNQNNAEYQKLTEEEQSIANKVIANRTDDILKDTDSDAYKEAKEAAEKAWQKETGHKKGFFEGDEDVTYDKYMEITYGKNWRDNYKVENKAGTNATIMKKNEDGGWENISDEKNTLSNAEVEEALVKWYTTQYNEQDMEIMQQLQSVEDIMKKASPGIDSDAIYDVQSALAEGGMVDLTLMSPEQVQALEQEINSTSSKISEDYKEAILAGINQYSETAHQARIEAEADSIITSGAQELEVTTGALESYTEELMENNEQLANNKKLAAETAVETFRFSKQLDKLEKTVKDNIKNIKNFNKNNLECYESLGQVQEALQETFGLKVSSDFIKAPGNIDLIAKAAEGNEEAIKKLGVAISKDYVDNLEIATDNLDAFFSQDFDVNEGLMIGDQVYKSVEEFTNNFNTAKQNVLGYIDEISNAGLGIGDSLSKALGPEDMSNFVGSLNEMAAATNMSVTEMQNMLTNMGVQAKVEQKWVPGKIKVPIYETREEVVNSGFFSGERVVRTSTRQVDEKEMDGGQYVASVTYDGSNPSTDIKFTGGRSALSTPSSNSGSGSGSNGSSSKPAKKSRSTKKTDIVDRYKETNDQLNKIKDTIEDTSREMDTLWGPKRLEAMDKYGKSLQKQIQTQGKYKQEIVDSLAIDKKAVQDFMKEMPNGDIGGLGDMGLQFTFDEDGYITNYTDVMTSLYTKLTEMEAHKNSLGTEEAQSEYENSTLGPFRNRVDELKSLVGQYDDTNQLLMDADNEYQEMIIEWQQNNYDQIVYKVELQVEFSELQLDQVEYYLDKIQDDWYSAAESVTLYGDQIVPLTGNIQSYIGMLDELKTKLNNNEINQAQYMEGLKEVQSGLIENINTLQDALESVGEYYLNTLDQINEKLDIQTSKFDGLTSVLEHYKEITTLINGEKDYKTLNNIVKSQRKLAEDQLAVSERKLTMYENQKAQVQSEIDKAKLLQDDKIRKQTLDKLEQDMAEIDNLIADEQSSIMEHITTLAELAMEELTNTLAEAKKRMEEAILGGEGLSIDSMLSQIERLNTKQEEYLTNTNKLYETNKLIRQAQMDMDKTDNQRAKQHYNDYIKYIEQLQQSGQLTQFELEMAQAEYDVLQKKIALEEAQEAKNQVRLTRDSEGNYGYVYTANQENIDKAEQEFADAQNARYNKALEGAKKYQDQYYQAIADMESALEELEEERANHLITDEEYEKRRAEIVDTYLTIAETSYELYFKATGIMMEESSNSLLDYELKGVGSMENLRDATEQYIEDSNKAFTTHDQKIDEVALHSEENFGKVEEGIGDVEEASQGLVLEINNNLIPTMENELAETLTNSMNQWYALATAIKTAREEAEKAMDVIQKETKLEGGFITDYSDEIAKELEKGEKADYEYINSLLAARDKKMGYLDTYDYSQMMEDYLAGGGKDTNAIYKAYELLREHKMEMWKNIDFDQMLKDHLASNGKIDDEKAKKILEARAQKINVLGVTDAISNEELIKQLTGDNTSATTETATASEEKKEDSAAAPDLVVGNKIEVKSGTKWYGSSTGTGGTGTAKGGTIKYINEGSNYPYNIDGLGWIKKSDIVGYNTGGYTGDWGPEGKLAILHEKELVLNAQDTENFLGGIAVLREISQMLDNNALIASLGAINLHAMTIDSPADQILQQEVTIHADFPNVTDHNEIEIAIDNLINAASQHAYQV